MADKKPDPKPASKPSPSCFIIMPLTTPDEWVDRYGGDSDHFHHVLEHLFVPAVEQAGFEPIRPIAKGSDVIQAEIIKHLELDDMVLCDMSTLNANVFFELGVRTAVGKPTCMVRDSLTPKVPFDIGMVNYHTYEALATWEHQKQVDAIAEHIAESAERSEGGNTLWHYFGLTKRAETEAPESPLEAKLDAILARFSGRRWDGMDEQDESLMAHAPAPAVDVVNMCRQIAAENGAQLRIVHAKADCVGVDAQRYRLSGDQISRMKRAGELRGLEVIVVNTDTGGHVVFL